MASGFFQLKMDFSSLTKELERLNPAGIYWTIIVCLWAEYFFELYLCIRQVSFGLLGMYVKYFTRLELGSSETYDNVLFACREKSITHAKGKFLGN